VWQLRCGRTDEHAAEGRDADAAGQSRNCPAVKVKPAGLSNWKAMVASATSRRCRSLTMKVGGFIALSLPFT
jgi:hypothetical protein